MMRISDRPTSHFFSNKVIEKIQIVEQKEEKILCNHCMRTASNGIRCMGICVADNDYWIKKSKCIQIIYYYSVNFIFMILIGQIYLINSSYTF